MFIFNLWIFVNFMFWFIFFIFDFSFWRFFNKNIIFKCIWYLYVFLLWFIDGDLCINKIDFRIVNFDSNRYVICIVFWVIKCMWISGFGIILLKIVFVIMIDVFEEKKIFYILVIKWYYVKVRLDMYYW